MRMISQECVTLSLSRRRLVLSEWRMRATDQPQSYARDLPTDRSPLKEVTNYSRAVGTSRVLCVACFETFEFRKTTPRLTSTNTCGSSVTALGNAANLVKTGNVFTGWNTQANGSGTPCAQDTTLTLGSANITLFAQWDLYGDLQRQHWRQSSS